MRNPFAFIRVWVKDWRHFDLGMIDWYEISSWPRELRAIALISFVLLFLSLLGFFILEGQIDELSDEKNKELFLKNEYQVKYVRAADLTRLKQQFRRVQTNFQDLVDQLPSETEVPALIEDVTRAGVNNGLVFKKIELMHEVQKDFYIELPITIEVSGSYHDLATFVSGVSSLSRIVTLHDFTITSEKNTSDQLSMVILAKTYRYIDIEKNPLRVVH